MVVRLKRKSSESCHVTVLGATLTVKDRNQGTQQTKFNSRAEAIAAAEKFISRRLKTGGWQIESKTSAWYYLQAIEQLEYIAAQARDERGYDRIKCHLMWEYPPSFTELDNLAIGLGLNRDRFPQSYRDFLLTMNGCQFNYYISKDGWGCEANLYFLPVRAQAIVATYQAEISSLQEINEPLLVVSCCHDIHDRQSLTGAILLLETGIVRRYESDMLVNNFDDFQAYFNYEIQQIRQRCSDARAWVDRHAGLQSE
jgi:hypothetical protein